MTEHVDRVTNGVWKSSWCHSRLPAQTQENNISVIQGWATSFQQDTHSDRLNFVYNTDSVFKSSPCPHVKCDILLSLCHGVTTCISVFHWYLTRTYSYSFTALILKSSVCAYVCLCVCIKSVLELTTWNKSSASPPTFSPDDEVF